MSSFYTPYGVTAFLTIRYHNYVPRLLETFLYALWRDRVLDPEPP